MAKCTNWSMKLAYKNLAVSAACMVLGKYVKMDLKCLIENDGLLAADTTYFFHYTSQIEKESIFSTTKIVELLCNVAG